MYVHLYLAPAHPPATPSASKLLCTQGFQGVAISNNRQGGSFFPAPNLILTSKKTRTGTYRLFSFSCYVVDKPVILSPAENPG